MKFMIFFSENTSLELKGTTSYAELILACNQAKIGYSLAQQIPTDGTEDPNGVTIAVITSVDSPKLF